MNTYSDTPSVQSIAGDYLYLRRPLPLNHLLHRRYRITGVLSEKGGFGMTYRAVDTYRNLNLAVVVKENFPLGVAVRNPETLALHPVPGMEDTYAKTLQRFEEEAELLSTLSHTNIVRVSAHFSELNTAYYIMPYIGGLELHQALPSPAELSEANLLPILRCLLKTLHYMHGYNLMHRDIKPNNILIDAEGTLKLIDFGLVRSTESTHTLTRNYTPGYAPVEQISGKGKSGPWTDLYSLGATCYALITGDAPPDALDRLEEDEYTPLQSRSELQSRYSPALLSGIDRALQVKRADRWQSAQEWLDDLQKFTSKPIITAPETIHVPQKEKSGGKGRKGCITAFAVTALALMSTPLFVNRCNPSADAELIAPEPPVQAVEKDLKELSFEELLKKAEQNDAAAQYNLAYCYLNGLGVSKDEKLAVEWYRKAAEQNFAAAQYNLGYCYLHGLGVSKDEQQAVEWYRKAAEQNYAASQYNLGFCYEHGIGVERNYLKALEWYKKAGEQGDEDALKSYKRLEQKFK